MYVIYNLNLHVLNGSRCFERLIHTNIKHFEFLRGALHSGNDSCNRCQWVWQRVHAVAICF